MQQNLQNDLIESLRTPKQLDESGFMSLVTQWKERNNGRLKFYQCGRKILYSPAHIQGYLDLCESELQNSAKSKQNSSNTK